MNIFQSGVRQAVVALVAGVLTAVSNAADAPAKPAAATTAAAQKVALPKLTAEQIVARNLSARGGEAAWKAVHAMTLSGKLDAGRVRKDGGYIPTDPGEAKLRARVLGERILEGKYTPPEEKIIQLPFKLDLARPNRQRLEIPFQGATALQVYDGTNGWKVRPFLGRHEVEAYTRDELAIAAEDQELDGPLVDYVAKGTRVALAGTEVVDGRPAYRLSLTYKNGAVRSLWIDGQNFLEVKIEGAPRKRDGHPRQIVTYLRDYHNVEGLMIPFLRVTEVQGETHVERIQIEKVVLNPSLVATNFSKPELGP
jgi:hypothetical protein